MVDSSRFFYWICNIFTILELLAFQKFDELQIPTKINKLLIFCFSKPLKIARCLHKCSHLQSAHCLPYLHFPTDVFHPLLQLLCVIITSCARNIVITISNTSISCEFSLEDAKQPRVHLLAAAWKKPFTFYFIRNVTKAALSTAR